SGWARLIWHRRAPPERFSRLRTCHNSQRSRRTNAAHSSHERRHRPELGRSGARVSTICNTRSDLRWARGDGRRAWIVRGLVSAVWISTRRLRFALRRKAGAASQDPGERAGPLVGEASRATHWPGRLPATAAKAIADL